MSTRRAVSRASRRARTRDETKRHVGNALAVVSAVFAKCLGSSCAFRKTGVCPRVAVRFAKILRVSPSAALPSPGSATTLATKLVEAIQKAIQKKNAADPARAFATRSSETPNVPRNPKPGVVRRVTPLATRAIAPASRAGAVAELLVWSGEAAAAGGHWWWRWRRRAVVRARLGGGGAHQGARRRRARAARAPGADAHADAGNHRAARRLASESLVDELRASDAEEAFRFSPPARQPALRQKPTTTRSARRASSRQRSATETKRYWWRTISIPCRVPFLGSKTRSSRNVRDFQPRSWGSTASGAPARETRRPTR